MKWPQNMINKKYMTIIFIILLYNIGYKEMKTKYFD